MGETVRIGEAAKLAGISVDTIRFYQKLGLVKGPARSPVGYRLFESAQIRDLAFIRHAQELGFSLSEVKGLVALRQKPHACSEVQSMLKRKLADVRGKMKSLIRLQGELAEALRKCNRELRLEREVKHEDCCPLLTRLEQVNGAGRRNGVYRTKSRKG